MQEFTSTTATTHTFKLNFNHPVKELIWFAIHNDYSWGSTSLNGGSLGKYPLYTDFSDTGNVQLKLNGHDRFAAQSIDYFTRYQPMLYHKKSSVSAHCDAIAVYSFALKPEEHQPSGTCNFSRIDSSQLTFANGQLKNDAKIHVFAVNYNVLRIMSGMGGLAYSN